MTSDARNPGREVLRVARALGLGQFHVTAAACLCSVHGLDYALEYLRQCKRDELHPPPATEEEFTKGRDASRGGDA